MNDTQFPNHVKKDAIKMEIHSHNEVLAPTQLTIFDLVGCTHVMVAFINGWRYSTSRMELQTTIRMNPISLSSIKDQLFGSDTVFERQSLAYIRRIQEWLGIQGQSCFQIPERTRIAPSLSTRSDAALFGLSIPRFAARLYADENHSTFFNLRRAALFRSKIVSSGGWTERRSRSDRRIDGLQAHALSPEIKTPAIIGDSVFLIPERFENHYRVITSELHPAYGDKCKTQLGRPCITTPFVQYFSITGLCSHAAILMASILLEKHAISIYGLTEIAALLRDPLKDEILITGLSPRHIARYFSHVDVGLKAFDQHVPQHLPWHDNTIQLSNTGNFSRHICFRHALRSYLLSGMPVIKHVDLARLHGLPVAGFQQELAIYKRNNTHFDLQLSPDSAEHHCVLIIGSSEEYADDFLIHDPGGMPYLEVSSSQLMNASTYVNCGPENPTPRLSSNYFQAVTPGKVCMPLHTYAVVHLDNVKAIPGLYRIAAHFYEDAASNSDPAYSYPSPREYLPGEFRLVQSTGILQTLQEDTWIVARHSPLSPALITDAESLQTFLIGRDPNHWFWIQRFDHCCWIWDAEEIPPATDDYRPEDLEKYLVGVISENHNPTVCKWLEDKAYTAERQNHSTAQRGEPLELSLITSFHSEGARKAFSNWPKNVLYAELYAFMQEDVEDLLMPGRGDLSAVQAMSQLMDDPIETDRIASDISSIARRGSDQIQIHTFATFIPELLDRDPNRRRLAKRAIIFLSHLAKNLRTYGHPVRTMEIVGGSIIEGICPVIYKSKDCFIANRKKPGSAQVDIFDEIRDVAFVLHADGVRLAIEAEPGPLFAFSSQAGIDALVAEIENLETTGDLPPGCVGLNLDVGHWILSRIQTEILGQSAVADRIFHAHLSDHCKCHTGDAIVGSINPVPVFETWIRELEKLPRSSFSGKISVEFECAKDADTLQEAIDSAAAIL